MAYIVDISCAQCDQPFEAKPSVRMCPHCGSARAAKCRDCERPIYLNGATTCAEHSEAGRRLAAPEPPDGAGTTPPPPQPHEPPRAGSSPGGVAAAGPILQPGSYVAQGDVVPARRRRRRWPALLAAVVVAGTLGGVAVPRLGGDGHPKSWDPRITDLVSFVERERGLKFHHPVRVEFLSDAGFRDLVTDREAPTEEEAAEMESAEAMLRAVGFITEDLDLDSVGEELAGDGVVGLYDFEERRIAVRGENLDNERRSTLVHELTHALQDQHFEIGKLEPETSGGRAALTAVVEADAEDVEAAWTETLSAADREALGAARQETSEGADFEGVPQVFIELMGFPYALGPGFLDAVMEKRGQSGRDEVLRRPPTTEEHILLPETYFSGPEPLAVPTPEVAAGERAIDDSEGDFGMLSLLVLLGERLDFSVAWPAVQGWAGDSVVAFERDGNTCVRVAVSFDEEAQAGRFGAAFTSWADGVQTVVMDQQGRSVTLEACDPGAGRTPVRPDGHVSGIQGLGLRQTLTVTLQGYGASPDAAACVADGLIGRLGADRFAQLDRAIVENPRSAAAREVAGLTADVAATCSGPR